MTSPSEPSPQNPQGNRPDEKHKSRSEKWLQDIAKRSTGLPAEESPRRPDPNNGDSNLWRLAGLGIQFGASTAFFAFLGYELDKKMGWAPWGLVALSLLAVLGNLYLLIKETLKQERSPKK